MTMKEISITEIKGFAIGNAEYKEGGTGCTVILAEGGAMTSVDIRGGAPASRECGLLNPLMDNESVNAVVLSGGSAFGLDAATGVMKYLEERGIGFPTEYGVVPIVCQSSLFDLSVGDAKVRPDAALGYQACENAGNFREGNYGAGTGASVGKIIGADKAMKGGIGAYALQVGELQVGAIVAVNAVGNVIAEDGSTIAGIHDGTQFISAEDAMIAMAEQSVDLFHQNTTIGAILTNGRFTKAQLAKIAGMAHDGYARAISPVHTMFDGDSIYVMSTGTVQADLSSAGTLAAKVMAAAIRRAAEQAESSYGLRAARDVK